ncbi:hypothetical protein F5888DRAFT_1857953 [Russula emetica]|nr:hypothetical protein F5888DRAFT_1857953 [Russula emetica]
MPWESRTMMAVAVQGAPANSSYRPTSQSRNIATSARVAVKYDRRFSASKSLLYLALRKTLMPAFSLPVLLRWWVPNYRGTKQMSKKFAMASRHWQKSATLGELCQSWILLTVPAGASGFACLQFSARRLCTLPHPPMVVASTLGFLAVNNKLECVVEVETLAATRILSRYLGIEFRDIYFANNGRMSGAVLWELDKFMNESQTSCSIDYDCSCPELDELTRICRLLNDEEAAKVIFAMRPSSDACPERWVFDSVFLGSAMKDTTDCGTCWGAPDTILSRSHHRHNIDEVLEAGYN